LTRTIPCISSATTGAAWGIATSPTAGRAPSYAGDGTSGIYLWGASLTATEYPVAYTTTRNLLTDSQDFERSTWIKSRSRILESDLAAPDGTQTAAFLQEDATASNTHYLRRLGIPTTFTRAFSFYAKAGTRTEIGAGSNLSLPNDRAVFDLSSGTILSQGANITSAIMVDVGGGWFRCELTTVSTQAFFDVGLSVSGSPAYSGDNVSGAYIWGMQAEPGTTATDYVRTVDTVGKAYGFYELTEGAVFVEAKSKGNTVTDTPIWNFHDGTNNNRIGVWRNSSGLNNFRVIVRVNNSTTLNRQFPTGWPEFTNIKIGLSAKHNDFSSTYDGNTPVSDSSAMPQLNTLAIGHFYPASLLVISAHIKRLTYWPVRQSDSTLQVITE